MRVSLSLYFVGIAQGQYRLKPVSEIHIKFKEWLLRALLRHLQ